MAQEDRLPWWVQRRQDPPVATEGLAGQCKPQPGLQHAVAG